MPGWASDGKNEVCLCPLGTGHLKPDPGVLSVAGGKGVMWSALWPMEAQINCPTWAWEQPSGISSEE